MPVNNADVYYQNEGTLRPENGVNIVTTLHILAFPKQLFFPPTRNYTDEAADIEFGF